MVFENLLVDLNGKKFEGLLYRGSRDGFRVSDFHRLCDNKKMTLTVIQTTDNKEFGGFTDIDFENKFFGKKANGNTFLFTIEMDKSVKLHKYKEGNLVENI